MILINIPYALAVSPVERIFFGRWARDTAMILMHLPDKEKLSGKEDASLGIL